MEPLNLNENPVPPVGNELPKIGSLSNLAQSARMKHIKSAKTVLVIVGVLTIVVSGVLYLSAQSSVDSEFSKEIQKLGPNVIIDQQILAQAKDEALRAARLGAIISVIEGVVFLLLGLNVHRAPVALTATGLILYIADYAIGAIFDPTYLYKGIIIKVIIIVCLFKALNAAIAYEKERKVQLAAT